MRIAKIVCVCACLLGFIQPGWSQKPDQSAAPGILGYLDPKTGAFRPLVQPSTVSEQEIESTAPTTGKFVFTFTITIASTNLSADAIVCGASATVFEVTNQRVFDESASVKASVSGSTATCKVTIPYSWTLSTQNSDMVALGFTVSAIGPNSSNGEPTRLSSQSLPSIKVPANGSTTPETIDSTI